jgi:hypothetical protein
MTTKKIKEIFTNFSLKYQYKGDKSITGQKERLKQFLLNPKQYQIYSYLNDKQINDFTNVYQCV